MDPRRPLCPECERTGVGAEDIAEIISSVDEFAAGTHLCVVCDRIFVSDVDGPTELPLPAATP